jgi:hypothetical protein
VKNFEPEVEIVAIALTVVMAKLAIKPALAKDVENMLKEQFYYVQFQMMDNERKRIDRSESDEIQRFRRLNEGLSAAHRLR